MNDPKQLVLNVTDRSLAQIEHMAKELRTTPSGVISQALALFMMAQGKKIVIKDQQQNKDLVIETYSKTPAPSEGK